MGKPTEYVQFATGMNGDEDLGEDIAMKGDKFHFVQNPLSANALIQTSDEAEAKKEAKAAEKKAEKVAEAKAEAKEEAKAAKKEAADPVMAESKKEAAEAKKVEAKEAKAAKEKADEVKKEGKKEGKKAGKKEAEKKEAEAKKPDGNGIVYDTTGYPATDKVHTLDPKITKVSSTFS